MYGRDYQNKAITPDWVKSGGSIKFGAPVLGTLSIDGRPVGHQAVPSYVRQYETVRPSVPTDVATKVRITTPYTSTDEPFTRKQMTDSGRVEMRELNPFHEVQGDRRQVAHLRLDEEQKALGLPRLTIRWFAPLDDEDQAERKRGRPQWAADTWWAEPSLAGFVHEDHLGEIWLSPKWSRPFDMAARVAHECRHIWQHLTYGDDLKGGRRKDWQESDAYDYSERLVAELLAR